MHGRQSLYFSVKVTFYQFSCYLFSNRDHFVHLQIQREGNKVGSGDSKDTSGIRKVAAERTVNEDVQIISSNKGGSSTEVRDVKTDYQMNEKHQDTVMEICPVSTMGMVENSWNTQTRSGSKAGILLWIEPADSGFIDMLQTAPPGMSYK